MSNSFSPRSCTDEDHSHFEDSVMKELEERHNKDQLKEVSKTDEILKKMQESSNGKVIHSQFYL
jgi:hypothetical protein